MAETGTEIKKTAEEDSVISKISGVTFSSIGILCSTAILAFMLILVNAALGFFGASLSAQMFLSSVCTYVFLISMLVFGGTNIIVSKFIADQICEGKNENVSSAIRGTGIFVALVTLLPTAVLVGLLYAREKSNIFFLSCICLMAVAISLCYNAILFLAAAKKYSSILLSFILGIAVGTIAFFIMYRSMSILGLLNSIIGAIVVTFLVMDIMLINTAHKSFPQLNTNYFEFIKYFKKYPYLFLSGLCYTVGFYISNVILWIFSSSGVKVSIFRTLPTYDVAMLFAIIVNITAIVIFINRAESSFSEKYKTYAATIVNSTYTDIESNKKVMMHTINSEMFFVCAIQLIITLVLECVGVIVLPIIGISLVVLNFFLILGISVFSTYLMYFTANVLRYFDDYFGSFLTTLTFLVVTTLSGFIMLKFNIQFFPITLVLGSIVSWIVGRIRLNSFIKTINAKLFCGE